jgi:CubicO group peptidase (beta-lactamase class C family)
MPMLPSLHRRVLCAAALSACVVGPAHAQSVPSDSAIRAIIASRVDSGGVAGVVVGILENGRRRFVSYGSAGPGRPALDEHTLFEIGSISKTFTGLLLADAVVRKEARLDQPVAELLPAGTTVPTRGGRAITLELLSTHRSGLPRLPANMAPAKPTDPYADYDAKRLYAFLGSHALTRAPGDSAEYSNLGAGLLGHALTLRARAPSWGALVRDRITGPLGMRETFVDVPASHAARVAVGHNGSRDTVPAWHLDALAGAGALRSSAADMLTFLAAQMDTSTGALARAIALGVAPRADFAPGLRVALGWLVAGRASTPIWWHNGGTGGFRSIAAFDPARKTAVVVLANSETSVDDIGLHLMDPSAPIVKPVRVPTVAVTVPTATLDRLVGRYPLMPALLLTVTREGDALFAQATGQPRFPLTPTAQNRYVFPAAGIELVFDLGETGPARQVTLLQGGQTIPAQRLP